jgi:hypothetical protein
MNQKTKSSFHGIVIILLISCVVPSVVAQTPRFRGHREFLPYTRDLPAIDKIELFKLEEKEGERSGSKIVDTRVLMGAKAQKIASLWRHQTYTASDSACHEPGYAIKFYSRGKLIAHVSVCWSCNNMYFITPDFHRTQNFAGYNKKGEELSEVFRLAFDEQQGVTFFRYKRDQACGLYDR